MPPLFFLLRTPYSLFKNWTFNKCQNYQVGEARILSSTGFPCRLILITLNASANLLIFSLYATDNPFTLTQYTILEEVSIYEPLRLNNSSIRLSIPIFVPEPSVKILQNIIRQFSRSNVLTVIINCFLKSRSARFCDSPVFSIFSFIFSALTFISSNSSLIVINRFLRCSSLVVCPFSPDSLIFSN